MRLLRWMGDSCCALDLMPPETNLNEAGRTEFSEERWKDKSSINWHKLARSEGPYSQTSFTFELLRSLADLAEDVGFKWSASRALKKKLSISVSIKSLEKQNINFIQIMWGMNNIIASIHFCFNHKVIFITSSWPLVDSCANWLWSGCVAADAWFGRLSKYVL